VREQGFTLVEILAAVTILGIISTLAVAGYTRYIDYSKNKAYDAMAKSVSVAAEEYIMTNPSAAIDAIEETSEDGTIKYLINEEETEKISIKDLIEEGYLNDASDPDNKGTNCKGNVSIGLVSFEEKGSLDHYIYTVDICCTNHKQRTMYTLKNKDNKLTSVEEKESIDTCE